jgi:hypothetical protein
MDQNALIEVGEKGRMIRRARAILGESLIILPEVSI